MVSKLLIKLHQKKMKDNANFNVAYMKINVRKQKNEVFKSLKEMESSFDSIIIIL